MEWEEFAVLGVPAHADWATVKAAYRALARRFHPDGVAPDPVRMAAINRAFDTLERARRQAADPRPKVPVGPGPAVRRGAPGSLLRRMEDARFGDSPVIDFGEYAGWRVADVARVNPTYLRWLSRHSSGARYRAAIAEALGDPDLGRRAAFVR